MPGILSTVTLVPATPADAAAIAALRMAAGRELTRRFGAGSWSFAAESEGGVRAELVSACVFGVWSQRELIATLKLGTRKPWLGDIGFFTTSACPVYLTAMAVAPHWQRRGIGRSCLEQVRREAARLNADMIRLDSYDGPAGAVEFYRKCGLREVQRAEYHGTALVWFETGVDPLGRGSRLNPAGGDTVADSR